MGINLPLLRLLVNKVRLVHESRTTAHYEEEPQNVCELMNYSSACRNGACITKILQAIKYTVSRQEFKTVSSQYENRAGLPNRTSEFRRAQLYTKVYIFSVRVHIFEQQISLAIIQRNPLC
ncbi:unnamed protein product [Calicophoron daubneyi]|uniref:Uncharacterized protein n=1 Tax=Calicophoron daubneyi TaxID=300641 RepID=A0AAV2T7W0_CALDB